MLYYVIDKNTNKKVYINLSAIDTRYYLFGKLGSETFALKNDDKNIYHINNVFAEYKKSIYGKYIFIFFTAMLGLLFGLNISHTNLFIEIMTMFICGFFGGLSFEISENREERKVGFFNDGFINIVTNNIDIPQIEILNTNKNIKGKYKKKFNCMHGYQPSKDSELNSMPPKSSQIKNIEDIIDGDIDSRNAEYFIESSKEASALLKKKNKKNGIFRLHL